MTSRDELMRVQRRGNEANTAICQSWCRQMHQQMLRRNRIQGYSRLCHVVRCCFRESLFATDCSFFRHFHKSLVFILPPFYSPLFLFIIHTIWLLFLLSFQPFFALLRSFRCRQCLLSLNLVRRCLAQTAPGAWLLHRFNSVQKKHPILIS